MNTYDSKHLQLLDLIETGQWQEIREDDVPELQVLVVCGYVSVGKGKDGQARVTLNPEGRHYHRHLERLANGAGSFEQLGRLG